MPSSLGINPQVCALQLLHPKYMFHLQEKFWDALLEQQLMHSVWDLHLLSFYINNTILTFVTRATDSEHGGGCTQSINATTVTFLPHLNVMIELSQSRTTLELQKLDLRDNPKDDSWKKGQFSNLSWEDSKGCWDPCSEGHGWMGSVEANGYGSESEAHLIEDLQFYHTKIEFKRLLKYIFLRVIFKVESFCLWNWVAPNFFQIS